MAVAKSLACLRRIGLNETGIAMRQIHDKIVRLTLHAGDHNPRLAKVHLGMPRIMRQGNKNLLIPLFLLTN